MDKKIRVKFAGGREGTFALLTHTDPGSPADNLLATTVFGVLKGFDQLMNLVMDEVDESLRDQDGNVTEKTRPLGLVVVRGTALTVINPADGYESIEKYVWIQRQCQCDHSADQLVRFLPTALSHQQNKVSPRRIKKTNIIY